ncbi:MAG TPA: hypothetical protein VF988_14150, partial [Verrucomicrobiae bacterium]
LQCQEQINHTDSPKVDAHLSLTELIICEMVGASPISEKGKMELRRGGHLWGVPVVDRLRLLKICRAHGAGACRNAGRGVLSRAFRDSRKLARHWPKWRAFVF